MNCPTQLHLVGHFYKIFIMIHGSMNVKDEMEWPCGTNRGLTNACRNLMGGHEAERYLASR